MDDYLLTDEEDEQILSREMLVNLEAKRLRLGPRPEACADVLRALNLEDVMDYIDCFNRSAKAPYHNAKHEAAVVTLVYEGGIYHGLGRFELRALVLAAAMHDFNHSAGKLTDDLNIDAAVKGLFFLHHTLVFTMSAITETELAIAKRLIKITQYPYVGEPADILEKLIRDADLMMLYLDDELRLDLFRGLKAELEVKAEKPYSKEEFADGVIDFYKKIAWKTEWAKEKAATQGWTQRIESLHEALLK